MASDGREFVALVTGATGAIGGAVARELASRTGTVVLVVRDRKRGEEFRRSLGPARARIELLVCDLSDPTSVRAAVGGLLDRHPQLSLLVHTAATFNRVRRVTPRGSEEMFATNHLGPFLLTSLLLSALRSGAPSRIVTVAAPATTHLAFDDLNGATKFSAFRAFGASKAANLLMTGSLAKRLEGTGVTPIAFHPGIVRSGLMRNAPAFARFISSLFGKPPATAAREIVRLGSDPSLHLEPGGLYTRAGKRTMPAYSRDPAVQEQLWSASLALVGATDH